MIYAGFRDVHFEEMTLALAFPSGEDCVQYLVDVSPALAALLSDKSSRQQTEYRQSLVENLRQYVMADGSILVPNVTICALGRR